MSTESGGAYHEIDDETGNPYWRLWGEGWKGDESMSPNEAITLDPRSFPPGTRLVIIEPDMDDIRSRAFYEAAKNFYPLKGKKLDKMLELRHTPIASPPFEDAVEGDW